MAGWSLRKCNASLTSCVWGHVPNSPRVQDFPHPHAGRPCLVEAVEHTTKVLAPWKVDFDSPSDIAQRVSRLSSSTVQKKRCVAWSQCRQPCSYSIHRKELRDELSPSPSACDLLHILNSTLSMAPINLLYIELSPMYIPLTPRSF